MTEILRFSSVPTGECWDSTFEQATDRSLPIYFKIAEREYTPIALEAK
jgi:hypothetical protein